MKKVWILNHYAIPPQYGGLVRHYYFSRYLNKDKYNVKIFTASKIHNTHVNMIEDNSLYREVKLGEVVYTFVKTGDYSGNGLSRINNMLEFPRNLGKACLEFAKKEKPDVIYASSPTIFVIYKAIKIARKLKVPCIVEVRDLWPESIVVYKNMSRKNPVIAVLYALEKWIYKNADKLIFTLPNAREYIIQRGWEKDIDLNKISIIGNGVDLGEFDYNKENYKLSDIDLEEDEPFKIVYAGSIRRVNKLSMIVEAAEILQGNPQSKIKFIIYGDGNEKEALEKRCKEKGLNNISFKGRVEKKFIPYIVGCADANLLHWESTSLIKYGISPNKLWDYCAAAKPVIFTACGRNDYFKDKGIGIFITEQTSENIANACLEMQNTDKKSYAQICKSARSLATEYDYKELAKKLEGVIELAIKAEK